MKSNDNHFEGNNIELPLPPSDLKATYEMEVYARFMRHLRQVPSSRAEIRILAAIQFVADMMDAPDAQIAKILVDLGLRAPRLAFPENYLEFIDHNAMRSIHEFTYACPSIKELQSYWGRIGEDKFAAFRRCYPSLAEGVFVTS